jgi:hypothetical protein
MFLGCDAVGQMKRFHCIPVADSISNLLQGTTFAACFDSASSLHPGIYCDISDGSVYQKIKSATADANVIEIILYQDAFEIVNPLGSAKKVYKIVAVYLTFGNVPSHVQTKIDNLKLVLFCREQELNDFCAEAVFGPMLKDLKHLATEGVVINNILYKARLLCVLGDNLGSHWLGGFATNFSTNRFVCRYCLVEKDKDDRYSLAKIYELRTPESHEEHVAQATREVPVKGALNDSVLHKLSFFHVCLPGLPPRLGHDLFEA